MTTVQRASGASQASTHPPAGSAPAGGPGRQRQPLPDAGASGPLGAIPAPWSGNAAFGYEPAGTPASKPPGRDDSTEEPPVGSEAELPPSDTAAPLSSPFPIVKPVPSSTGALVLFTPPDVGDVQTRRIISEEEQAARGWSNSFTLDRSVIKGGSPQLAHWRSTIRVIEGDAAAEQFDGILLDLLRGKGGFVPQPPAPAPVTPATPPAPVTPTPVTPAPGDTPDTPSTGDTFLYGPGGQPQADDIKQDALGDCYFVATLGSLAANQPQAIVDAIHARPDGSYDVTLHVADANGNPVTEHGQPVVATVNVTRQEVADNIARQGGSRLDNTAGGAGAAWPAVMEVAYAKLRAQVDLHSSSLDDGYQLISNGGYVQDTLYAVTGQQGKAYSIGESNEQAAVDMITRSLSEGRAVVLGTWEEKSGTPADGLVDGHAYEVVGVTQKDGEAYITLRNPWGEDIKGKTDEYNGPDTADSGLLTVRLSDVCTAGCDTLFVGEPPQDTAVARAASPDGGSSATGSAAGAASAFFQSLHLNAWS